MAWPPGQLDQPARCDDSVLSLPGDGIERTNFGKDIQLDVSKPEKERQHGYFAFRLIYDQPGLLDWLWNFPTRRATPPNGSHSSSGSRPRSGGYSIRGIDPEIMAFLREFR